MKNRRTAAVDLDTVLWTNDTGAAVSAGNEAGTTGVTWLGRRYGVALAAIASLAAGALVIKGGVMLAKASGDVFAEKQQLWWDATNLKVVATPMGPAPIGITREAAASGTTVVEIDLNAATACAAVATIAASTAVNTTASATKFDTQLTIPKNSLKAGSVVTIKYKVLVASVTTSSPTLGLKAFLGATEVQALATVAVAANDIGYGEVDVVVRTGGASGTCVAMGLAATGTPGTITAKAVHKASQALDTTVDNAVAIEATWSASSASNSATLEILEVQVK